MTPPTTAFQRALEQYLQSLPSHKKKSKFLLSSYNAESPVTPESLNEAITHAEERASQRSSRKILRKVVAPVVAALKDYFTVIDPLVSSSMPAAIVWGAVKGIDRCATLFDTIKSQLRALTVMLQRISEFEELYSDSTILQDLLCRTYVEIFRFWSRVDRECIKSFLRVAVSFTTKKIDESIREIETNVDAIEKLAPIIEARRARGEQEDAERERTEAGIERSESRVERQAQREFREMYQDDRYNERYLYISSWIDSREAIESNQNRHDMNIHRHSVGTCAWLIDNNDYCNWEQGVSSPSIVWCHAPPGTGKSILCSQIIQKLRDTPSVAIAYLFYQFDVPYTAVETLRLLAAQLITSSYLTYHHKISDNLYLIAQGARTFDSLCAFINMLIQQFQTVYLLFDGLDEECVKDRWPEACRVIDFLVNLAKGHPRIVRLWFSSQDRTSIRTKMEQFTICDFHDHMKADVGIFLANLSSKLQDLVASEQAKSSLLNQLQKRGESNFLWVNLMVNTLHEEASSPLEVTKLLEDGFPSTLDGYYRRIFGRFEVHQWGLVCKVFSLIAFARRPLRMSELREAIGILSTNPSTSLDAESIPFEPHLRKLFAPLIQMHPIAESNDYTCRLFHSTVRDFLRKSGGKVFPKVLSGLVISSEFSARACLAYLRQPRYSRALSRHENRLWVDSNGDAAEEHLFLLYAAKYWDKHFDEVSGDEETRKTIISFITSSNFQTFVQIQSLWLENRFTIFRKSNGCECDDCTRIRFLVRVFPLWLINGSEVTNERRLWASYRRFIHDWRHLLSCANCKRPGCVFSRCAGEIDRCWWGALGPRNFLSKLEGRYRSFSFQREGSVTTEPGPSFEGITPEGDKMKILRLNDSSTGTLTFACEHWSIRSSYVDNIVLENTQIISVSESQSSWSVYVTALTETSNRKRVGRAPLAAFTPDCQYMRIGTQLFELQDDKSYVSVYGTSGYHYPAYIEEFVVRGPYAAFASRRRVKDDDIRKTGVSDETVANLGVDFNTMEEIVLLDDDDDSASAISSLKDDSDSFQSSSDVSELNDAYESWSEGDTDILEGVEFEEDRTTPWAGPGEDLNEIDSSSDMSSDTESSEQENESPEPSGTNDESSDEEIELSPQNAAVGYGRWYDEEAEGEDDEDAYMYYAYGPAALFKPRSDIQASISVFAIRTSTEPHSPPQRLFHYAQELPIVLYNSPPIIHPFKSLIVWPIGRGDVLFADFSCRSYFTRKLRLTTSHSAHISVKCHFSDCGRYLFIAAFEGQRKPAKDKRDERGVKIALLVLTYQLSESKTARSPPRLIHRTRLDLGQKDSISVSTFPFTLSWTAENVYLACSDEMLEVYRIDLFSSTARVQTECTVSVPQQAIILPSTATKRKVHYMPPTTSNLKAKILIESEARVKGDFEVKTELQLGYQHHHGGGVFGMEGAPVPISPPIGCFIDEEKDLGYWSPWKGLVDVPGDFGIGHLDRRLEKFDFDDDCDCAFVSFLPTYNEVDYKKTTVEPYIF
ncbi:hypothetical protein J3R30DRAFT_3287851 [Lentinula aciculospora]|uniref:Nephrocystin 3-like N-terminal domain-containing protein n=1 Tax=Lentinula aciculospora TaxID=153920 RepID=A0A9W9AEV9_9AGAR|nr:hypothetical protein J3R30DRAFT_3287851 [Lentinula aciculospora]